MEDMDRPVSAGGKGERGSEQVYTVLFDWGGGQIGWHTYTYNTVLK